ncbi:MAG: hypothetical protein K0S45_1794 [Nitrospira sp.]|nr:hypothetical protein [Nitrospira sp.]
MGSLTLRGTHPPTLALPHRICMHVLRPAIAVAMEFAIACSMAGMLV